MADLLALSSRVIDSGLVDQPVNRVNNELSEVADGIAMVESFSHCVALRTDEGLTCFDASGVMTGQAVRESLRGWTTDRVSHLVYTHGHADHLAIEGFTSLSFSSDGPFALRKFQNFLDNQLPAGVFRAKGILWFNESERRHVFHLAGKRFSIDDSDWSSPSERRNQLVLIGKQLDHAKLRKQLQACVAKDAGKGFR